MPSSICWPSGANSHLAVEGNVVGLEGVGARLPRKQLAPVDPRPEIGGAGDIGGGGDDPRRQLAVGLGQIVEDFAERHLRRDLAVGRDCDLGRGDHMVGITPPAAREERRPVKERLKRFGIVDRGELLPLLALGHAHVALPLGHLGLVHQPAVIVLVAGDRRAPALDRVGEETDRAVMIDRGEGVGHGRDAIAAEIFHQFRQLPVGTRLDEPGDVALVAEIVHQVLAPHRAAHEGQRRIELVGASVDPVFQLVAALLGEGRALQVTVLDPHHVPAEGLEDLLDAPEQPLVDDAIERLTIVVDDPPGVAQVVLPALLQRLVDIALVEFGVADQRHHAAGLEILTPILGGDVVLHDRGERGDGDAQSHRTRGEIDVIDVLGPRRVGLHPAKPAEILHLLARLVAHQVLHRVEDRRGVRLDRHPVLGPERGEIERRHDRHHRGRRRLVPADLDPVDLGADVVGVVDHPVRQPQQPLFDGLEMGGVHGSGVPPCMTVMNLSVSMLPPHRMTPTRFPAIRAFSCASAASGAAPAPSATLWLQRK